MSSGGGSTSVDTSGMERLYQEALDHAIEQDDWNRQFLQTQWDWAAEDRDRLLAENATDREMFYGMLGQDRAIAQDNLNYNRAANEMDRSMFQEALAAHQGSIDSANAQMSEEWDWNRGNIEADRAYYDANFKPLEQALIADSTATAGDYAAESAKASADVAGAFDKQQGIQRREMARYGINPASGRYASSNRALGLGRAAAEVGARTQARENVSNRADANRAVALNAGQTHRNTQILAPNRYASYGMASFKSTPSSYSAPMSTPGSYGGYGAPGNYQSTAAGVAQNFAGAMGDAAAAEASANAQESSGLWGAAGTGLGLFFSSREYKKDIAPFDPQTALHLLGSVEPVEFYYRPGMGPEGLHIGAIAEDVPAVFASQDRKALNQYNLVGALVAAVQALAGRVEALESRRGPCCHA